MVQDMFPDSDTCFADLAHHLTTACSDLDDLDHDLSRKMCELVETCHLKRRTATTETTNCLVYPPTHLASALQILIGSTFGR